MALVLSSHAEGRIHVDVVAGKIERDEDLEEDRPAWPGRREENEKTGSGAAIRHHVKDSAELCGLLKVSRRIPVQRVEEAGDAVQAGTCPWVERHVVKRCEGKDDAGITYTHQMDCTCLIECSHSPIRLGQKRKMFSFFSVLATLWADPLPFTVASSRGAGEGVDGVDMAACLRVLTPDISFSQAKVADGDSLRCRVSPLSSGNLLHWYLQTSTGEAELVDHAGKRTPEGRKG